MRIKHLPALFFGVLFIVAGCKKNTNTPPTTTPTPQCTGPELLAENVLPDYIKNSDGSGNNIFDVIASDPSGNVYVENTSQQFSNFGNALDGISGETQGYLYKFDDMGKQVYNKPDTTGDESVMAVDSMQNVYIGYFTIFSSPWHCMVNVMKYNSTGNALWSKHIYYNSDALFSCLGVSNRGILHVTANVLSGPIDQQYVDTTVVSEGGYGNMVYTFDQAGTLTHVKQVAPFAGYYTESYLFFPSGNFYDVNYTNGAVVKMYDINSQLTNTVNIPVPANQSVFFDNKLNIYSVDSTSVTKYNSGYTTLWTAKTPHFRIAKTDAGGNVYIGGTFSGTVDFNPGGTAKKLTAKGSSDSFIEKLDSNGKFVWAIQSLGIDGKTYTSASQIDNFLVTSKNEVFVTGSVLNSQTNTNTHFAVLYTQCN